MENPNPKWMMIWGYPHLWKLHLVKVMSRVNIFQRVGNCLGIFFLRLGNFFWILGWTRSVCYFQHFGVGNCYDLTYSQHFGVRCSLFPCYLQHFGRSVCHFQHFGVGNETVTTAAPPMSKTRKAVEKRRGRRRESSSTAAAAAAAAAGL